MAKKETAAGLLRLSKYLKPMAYIHGERIVTFGEDLNEAYRKYKLQLKDE